ncbi:hypothetical protein J5N97_017050 [Dioscorea zingiberensis]|uniref:Uncharacterized protein n=1 Tax=Dioscorea zingiberensis TaxID=325984 RepID=A0A9D5CN47_9LILI|nr:hypothetical protein J5N97_017050 [Dioscorea zingiberensis]
MLETLDSLMELSDLRSKIVEEYKDDDESFSYKICIDRLTSLPDITAEEMFIGGQAFKQREERIYFLTILALLHVLLTSQKPNKADHPEFLAVMFATVVLISKSNQITCRDS